MSLNESNPPNRAVSPARAVLAVARLFVFAFLLSSVGCLVWFRRSAAPPPENPAPLSSEAQPAFQAWRSNSIEIPARAWEAEAFNDETIALAKKLRDLWRENLKDIVALDVDFYGVRRGEGGFTNQFYKPPQELYARLRPLFDTFNKLVNRDDYSMEVFVHISPPDAWGEIPDPHLNALYATARLRGMEVWMTRNDADTEGAISGMRDMLRATRVNPYGPSICHTVGISICAIAAARLQGSILLRLKNEPELKEALRSELKSAYATCVEFAAIEPTNFSEDLTRLREYQRLGVPVRVDRASRMGLASALWKAQAGWLCLPDAVEGNKPSRNEKRARSMMINAALANALDLDPSEPENPVQSWIFQSSSAHPVEELRVRAKASAIKISLLEGALDHIGEIMDQSSRASEPKPVSMTPAQSSIKNLYDYSVADTAGWASLELDLRRSLPADSKTPTEIQITQLELRGTNDYLWASIKGKAIATANCEAQVLIGIYDADGLLVKSGEVPLHFYKHSDGQPHLVEIEEHLDFQSQESLRDGKYVSISLVAADSGDSRYRSEIEGPAFERAEKSAWRKGNQLFLRLSRGDVRDYSDRDTFRVYHGPVEGLPFHVVSSQYNESTSFSLIHNTSGKETYVENVPTVSPDRQRFITFTPAEIDMYGSPLSVRMQVWKLASEEPVSEWHLMAHYWGVEAAKWKSDREIELTVATQNFDLENEEAGKFVNSTFSLRLADSGWTCSVPEGFGIPQSNASQATPAEY